MQERMEKNAPNTDVVIDIGGEDSKIIYLSGITDYRMNGACAGGTGIFIDQMAAILSTDAAGLNELSKNSRVKHTIAARCGVFAKTDINNLLSEGARKEDIAAAVFQAVAHQTVGALACGRKIRGNIAFVGGPFQYLSELKKAFIQHPSLQINKITDMEDAHLINAKGAALASKSSPLMSFKEIPGRLELLKESESKNNYSLPRLFASEKQLLEFRKRHALSTIPQAKFNIDSGEYILGIDAGSTTSKLVLINLEGKMVYSLYENNVGNSLETVIRLIKKLYTNMPQNSVIVKSSITGYGEALIKKALTIDLSDVETIAHYRAARQFAEDVETIIDIGGQDMKYIKIKGNRIDKIMLNEACSSGCGSFLETFAGTLGLKLDEFCQLAIESENPVDLGTRCTIFMNSKIKQAQKEGSSKPDIIAGLCYSVVRNALDKVFKIKDGLKSGGKIVLQGGMFYNEAVLRAFENSIGRECLRPDHAGLMGAYGIALIALDQYKAEVSNTHSKAPKGLSSKNMPSGILSKSEIDSLKLSFFTRRCQKCENSCLLTITKFNSDREYISGNKCEQGLTIHSDLKEEQLPNLYSFKYNRVFNYQPLDNQSASRGIIGIPRVLNMYENYPFWFTFFTSLGFRVELSDKTSKQMYESGLDSVPSESVCCPAKTVHGHIENLISKGIKTIFHPCLPFERKEDNNSENCFNCPIVSAYPVTINNNVENLSLYGVNLINPYLSIWKGKFVDKFLQIDGFKKYKLEKWEVNKAYNKAKTEYLKYKQEVRDKGEAVLNELKDRNLKGIVLAGRPYHIDPGLNHGIDKLINGLGFAVLSEDSISHLGNLQRPIRVYDQWTYPTRIYSAASVVCHYNSLELVQLSSFGCGLDAITTEQVEEILSSADKIHTVLKIDEVSNLGAVKIRIRSLIRSLENRETQTTGPKTLYTDEAVDFSKAMSKEYTMLAPHIDYTQACFLKAAFESEGHKIEILREITSKTVETGLKYVNNDACYPAVLVIGQLIEALKSNSYDNSRIALAISQSGTGCRDNNYIALLRRGLKKAGYPEVPVVSLNLAGLDKSPGFKFTVKLMNKLVIGTIYSDLLLKLILRIRPYELIPGSTEELHNKWFEKCRASVEKPHFREFNNNIINMLCEFDAIPIHEIRKPVVGIVGELFLKYNTQGNNELVKLLEKEGAEAVMPTVVSFSQYMISNPITSNSLYVHAPINSRVNQVLLKLLDIYLKPMKNEFKKYTKFHSSCDIFYLADKVKSIVSVGNQTGEGWYLPAKMLDYLENGIENILCIQPFACLSNHITGKGVIKAVKQIYPNANIATIDYDSGISQSNQINRIKLFLEIAKNR
ncbi:MAG: R-phenyllactate dehydratase activator [Firmicutes bacterium ADurb.Bin419]|nr:MAG: R-phenyllactate dehydratase activator [Firmicutes bacterium ADurb.Bin419]